jgi:hypothetical protein
VLQPAHDRDRKLGRVRACERDDRTRAEEEHAERVHAHIDAVAGLEALDRLRVPEALAPGAAAGESVERRRAHSADGGRGLLLYRWQTLDVAKWARERYLALGLLVRVEVPRGALVRVGVGVAVAVHRLRGCVLWETGHPAVDIAATERLVPRGVDIQEGVTGVRVVLLGERVAEDPQEEVLGVIVCLVSNLARILGDCMTLTCF